MLVIGRSYWVVPIQNEDMKAESGMKLAEEIIEKSSVPTADGGAETTYGVVETTVGTELTAETVAKAEAVADVVAEGVLTAGTILMAYCGGRTAGTKTGKAGAVAGTGLRNSYR